MDIGRPGICKTGDIPDIPSTVYPGDNKNGKQ
jgi:hypothetical protein